MGAYVAAVESGTVDSEDLRARRAVIRFHLRELDEAVLLRGEALPFLLEGIV
ncbi:hypothetical protein [Streptomyces sp. NPDC101165]|uniref:hypothetical protein n=1 Tax=Streptomyces sp. NPDC101165 TaxID=3366119 RepID=UPI0038152354